MLHALIDLCIRRHLAVLAVILGISIYGIKAYLETPAEAFPDVTNIQVNIIAQMPGLAPEEIERQVTVPLERALNGTPSMILMRSESLFGLSLISLVFDDDADSFTSRALVSERLMAADVAEGAEVKLAPDATPLGEIYQFRVVSDRHTLTQTRSELEWTIARILKQVPGVADVVSFGGFLKELHVEVDPARLLAHDLTLADVTEALEKSNRNVGGGFLKHGDQELAIRGVGYLRSARDVQDIVLRSKDGTPVTIGDVARIVASYTPRRGSVGFNLEPNVAEGFDFDIDDALRILRSESPRWAAEVAQLGVAEADVLQAGVWSNPSLSYNVLQLAQGANTGAVSTHQVILEQPLLIFGQRGKRLEAAHAAQGAARAGLVARFAEHARELHHTFVEILGAQEKLRLLTESQQEIQRAEAIVRGRATAGDRSQYDVLRTALEARALDSELATAETERLDAVGRLAQLLGRPGWSPRARGDLTPIEPSQAVELLWERAQKEHPAIESAWRRIGQAEAALAQARRERLPEIALQVGMVATQAENSQLQLRGAVRVGALGGWRDAEGAQQEARGAVENKNERIKKDVKDVQRPGREQRHALGLMDRQRLGHELTGDRMKEGDGEEGQRCSDAMHHARALGHGAEEEREEPPHQRRQRRLAEPAERDRSQGHPELVGREVGIQVTGDAQGRLGTGVPLFGQPFQASRAHLHDGELGRDEKRVCEQQEETGPESPVQLSVHATTLCMDTGLVNLA